MKTTTTTQAVPELAPAHCGAGPLYSPSDFQVIDTQALSLQHLWHAILTLTTFAGPEHADRVESMRGHFTDVDCVSDRQADLISTALTAIAEAIRETDRAD